MLSETGALLRVDARAQWRRQGLGDDNPVTSHLATAWTLLQPLLFSLIGAEVDTDKLDTNVLGLAVVVIIIGD